MTDYNKIEQFWNSCHTKKAVESLTGASYSKTIEFLKIKDSLKPLCRVLEVGPGLGYVTEGLYKDGFIVNCLDISSSVLSEIEKFCERTYTINDLDKLPSDYFDVIICANVIQHIDTELLIKELYHCVRSLKIGGTFAIQFVSNDEIEDMGINPNMKTITSGGCCRTPKYLGGLIEETGGKCKLVFSEEVEGNSIIKENYIFHVTK